MTTALSTGNLIRDLQRWFDLYKIAMTSRSFSLNTTKLYERAFSFFVEYARGFAEETDIKELKTIHFIGFISYLETNAKRHSKKKTNGYYLSKATKDAYIKGVKGLFAFIADNNDEEYSYFKFLKNLKITDSSKPEDKIKHMDKSEVEKLLLYLEKAKLDKEDDFIVYRNSLLIKLMLFGSLRISEALNLKMGDFVSSVVSVDSTGNTEAKSQPHETYNVSIFGKGGKKQVVTIPKNLGTVTEVRLNKHGEQRIQRAINIDDEIEYFEKIARLGKDEFIMKTKRGNLLDRTVAFRSLNQIYKKAGIKKTGLHMLRHTSAMRMRQEKHDMTTIQAALRHSNLATTSIYAKVSSEEIVKARMGVILSEA